MSFPTYMKEAKARIESFATKNGLQYNELAQMLGVSTSTVHRARGTQGTIPQERSCTRMIELIDALEAKLSSKTAQAVEDKPKKRVRVKTAGATLTELDVRALHRELLLAAEQIERSKKHYKEVLEALSRVAS